MERLRLATVWLGGCSGCHMSFLDLDEWLIDLASMADVVSAIFRPTVAGPIQASISITSDDPDEPLVDVPLVGAGVVPPAITVTPSIVELAIESGQTTSVPIVIANGGGSDLSWSASLEVGTGGTVVASSPAFEGNGLEAPDDEPSLPSTIPPPDHRLEMVDPGTSTAAGSPARKAMLWSSKGGSAARVRPRC